MRIFSRLNMSLLTLVFILLQFVTTNIYALENQEIGVDDFGIKQSDSIGLLAPDVLPVNDRIIALLELTAADTNKAKSILSQLLLISENFNKAERYLMDIVQARISAADNNIDLAILTLQQAKLLEENIVSKQLNTPLFYQLYLDLADYYVALKSYELAFNERKEYQERYKEYLKAEKENTVNVLNRKYETSQKQKQNELLAAENKLKQLQITDTENQQFVQQRNIIALVCTTLLFMVLIVRQIRIRKKLKILSQTDTLTGLLNRRSLFERGPDIIKEMAAQQHSLSAILLDLDHFKIINDTYGHDIGDKVIKMVTALGSETMRSRDVFARLGGDEFVAILPDATLDEARAIAQRFLEKIAAYPIESLGVKEPVSASFGVVNLSQISGDFDSLIHAADEAMYQAKANGKNQICSYDSALITQ